MPFAVDEVAISDYYSYGMLIPERSWLSQNYRYGFGGHELDNEVKGNGNHLSFGDYGYDTRTVRRWNIEPKIKKYPHLTSYIVFGNNPILYKDPTGLDWLLSTGNKIYWYGGKYGDKSQLIVSYKASSGHNRATNNLGEINNFQVAKYQNFKNYGPTPEGKYQINLKPDPEREAKVDAKTL